MSAAGSRRAAGVLLALGAALLAGACGPEPAARPSVRFTCVEGCGSFKTVFAGEQPPPCCGSPMAPPLPGN